MTGGSLISSSRSWKSHGQEVNILGQKDKLHDEVRAGADKPEIPVLAGCSHVRLWPETDWTMALLREVSRAAFPSPLLWLADLKDGPPTRKAQTSLNTGIFSRPHTQSGFVGGSEIFILTFLPGDSARPDPKKHCITKIKCCPGNGGVAVRVIFST